MATTENAPKPTTNRDRVSAHAIARLRTFIEAECSNFGQGRCLPADGPCRVTERQEPCRYFEISVLPIVWMHPAHNRSGEYAAETYAEINRTLREAVLDAYAERGGVKWLSRLPDRLFVALLQRILPRQVSADLTMTPQLIIRHPDILKPGQEGARAALEQSRKARVGT
jgi:hypothetical protein